MRALALLLGLAILVGCGGKDGGGAGGTAVPPAAPGPTAHSPLRWGELTCQKSSTCKNGVLNLNETDLLNFLEREFSAGSPVDGPRDFKIYQCGALIRRTWQRQFPNWTDGSTEPIEDFLLQVIDPEPCRIRDQLRLNLQNFFQTTQEYKNEIARH